MVKLGASKGLGCSMDGAFVAPYSCRDRDLCPTYSLNPSICKIFVDQLVLVGGSNDGPSKVFILFAGDVESHVLSFSGGDVWDRAVGSSSYRGLGKWMAKLCGGGKAVGRQDSTFWECGMDDGREFSFVGRISDLGRGKECSPFCGECNFRFACGVAYVFFRHGR